MTAVWPGFCNIKSMNHGNTPQSFHHNPVMCNPILFQHVHLITYVSCNVISKYICMYILHTRTYVLSEYQPQVNCICTGICNEIHLLSKFYTMNWLLKALRTEKRRIISTNQQVGIFYCMFSRLKRILFSKEFGALLWFLNFI